MLTFKKLQSKLFYRVNAQTVLVIV